MKPQYPHVNIHTARLVVPVGRKCTFCGLDSEDNRWAYNKGFDPLDDVFECRDLEACKLRTAFL